MEKLLRFIVRQRSLVLLLSAGLVIGGIWAVSQVSLDAIPDVTDNQVTIYTVWGGQDSKVIEDQITYPITTTMLHVPGAKSVRGYSTFGASLVYVILEDNVDFYWARSRVLEYLDQIKSTLPKGVEVGLGPDATGVGWIYEYALKSDKRDLIQLRSIQDWYLRYGLASIPGVAEVASVGGGVKQYQVELDPFKLRAYGIPLKTVLQKVRDSNLEEGGRWIENAGNEILVRGLGYVGSPADLEKIVLKVDGNGTPITLNQLGHVVVGMEDRRGSAELDGQGEVVGGIVIARPHVDALRVVKAVKAQLARLKESLPADVKIIPVYDRSQIIERSISTLMTTLIEEAIIVVAVVLIFLAHFRSSLVILLPVPLALFGAILLVKALNVTVDIMVLGGIAIAMGAMVDAGIVLVENAHKHLERAMENGAVLGPAQKTEVVLRSLKQVMLPVFTSLVVIALAFIPVLFLTGEEGRMFRPLVIAKTAAMVFSTFLAVVLTPVLILSLVSGPIRPEESNVLNRSLIRIYHRLLLPCLHHRVLVLGVFAIVGAITIYLYQRVGSEFMPPLYEGDVLYMPNTFHGVSITAQNQVATKVDGILKQIPEVEHVFGKVGRAETATDSAHIAMIESTIQLKPKSEWRPGMTYEKLIDEFDQKIKVPGLPNVWTKPIRGRIDMVSTGLKSPLGIKVYGPHYDVIDKNALQIQDILRKVPGTRNVFAYIGDTGKYLEVGIDRDKLQRYGLTIDDAQTVIRYGIGGGNVAYTVEGRERYPISVRYQSFARDTREDMGRNALVSTPAGNFIPLGLVADIHLRTLPVEFFSENASLVDYVYIDVAGTDYGDYIKRAEAKLRSEVKLPAGVYYQWSGQYEGLIRARNSLTYIVPIVILTIAGLYLLLYGSLNRMLIVLLSVPFSLIGAVWLLAALHYHLSVAVAVGMLAAVGISAAAAVVMLIYLDIALEKARAAGLLSTKEQLFQAVYEGAVLRLRPKTMTVSIIILSLLPLMWSQDIGADVMKRIAAPMVGGMISSAILVLFMIPVIYSWVEERRLRRAAERSI